MERTPSALEAQGLLWTVLGLCRWLAEAALWLWYTVSSLQWLLLLWSRASRVHASVVAACGLSSCGFQALEHRLKKLWGTGLIAPWHVGSSQVRARTCVSRTGRLILYP